MQSWSRQHFRAVSNITAASRWANLSVAKGCSRTEEWRNKPRIFEAECEDMDMVTASMSEAEGDAMDTLHALAQDEAMLSLLERQARVQGKLFGAQARLQQQDARLAMTTSGSAVTQLVQMAAPLPAKAPLIVGGPTALESKPEG